MDHVQQKQISTDPCGPKVQHGPCAFIGAGPVLPPQLAIQQPPPVSPLEVLKKQSGLSPVQAAVAPLKVAEQMQSGHVKSASNPEKLASICRPRPTALGTKPAPKQTRISLEPSKEIDLIPVCIPGPQSASVLSHSPTQPSLSPHSPQGPLSPQPYLSPSASISPKAGLSPQSQRSPSPGSATQSQLQSEKTSGDNNDFR